MDEEDLAAAAQLPADGVADDLLVEFGDVGPDRLPLLGRGLDDAQIPDPGQRHLQGAGDGGRGEGQGVDIGPQPFELFLVGHAEAVLFVDHQQPEVFEDQVLLQEAVGADDQVHLSLGRSWMIFFCSAGERKRLSISTRKG